tara:strand:+ start:412 stop:900 length:489 start_codon:yes stop_codon:yes gene_type:complete
LEHIENLSENQLDYEGKKTPLQKVGAFLREGRQARSISIEELSSSLRIGKEQLEALENGQEDFLPEEVFIKAMVRRISDKLGLETNFILQELKGREIKTKNLYDNKYIETQKSDLKPLIPWMIITSGVLGLFCSIPVINYFQNFISSPIQDSSMSLKIIDQK